MVKAVGCIHILQYDGLDIQDSSENILVVLSYIFLS